VVLLQKWAAKRGAADGVKQLVGWLIEIIPKTPEI